MCLHMQYSMCIFWLKGKLSNHKNPILAEPPASFVFLRTVSFVVIIVLVIGAEFNTLVTGPPWHTNLITSRQSISSCTHIISESKSVVILQREMRRTRKLPQVQKWKF